MGTGSPFDINWESDYQVTKAGAELLANLSSMRITALDSYIDAATGVVRFVTLREDLPAKTTWTWIPATTAAGVQSWLAANPNQSPMQIDSLEVGGVREYHVMAVAADPSAPAPLPFIRTRKVIFGQSLAQIDLDAKLSGMRLVDLDQTGIGTYDAILEAPAPGEPPFFITSLDIATEIPCDQGPCQFSSMERPFGRSFFDDGQGYTENRVLLVNNAWPIQDIFGYLEPSPGYRGCPGTLGSLTLKVTSSSPWDPHLGATIQFDATPVLPGSAPLLVLGFQRYTPIDLALVGPSCWLIPTPDILIPTTAAGTSASASLQIPLDTALLGLRVYAQYAMVDSFAGNIQTSNAYLVTIQ
jgi:hypothetical protein